jgi:hypothetical protein
LSRSVAKAALRGEDPPRRRRRGGSFESACLSLNCGIVPLARRSKRRAGFIDVDKFLTGTQSGTGTADIL